MWCTTICVVANLERSARGGFTPEHQGRLETPRDETHIFRIMRTIPAFTWLLVLLLITTFVGGQEWNCQSPECLGHKAGYDWAVSRSVTEEECDVAGEHYNSPSFAEGCKSAVIAKRRFLAAREQLMPLFQAYALGQQVAKESRALPSDCQAAYDSMTSPNAAVEVDAVAAIGFKNGCLGVAKKQAKRIIKEDEKRAREAAKQAKKQGQSNTHN